MQLYNLYKKGELNMGLRFESLNEITRRYMIEEIDHSIGRDELYKYEEFTDDGWKKYPELLRKAAQEGDDDFLGVTLYHNNCFRLDAHRESYTKFAELEFNKFYIRAMCRHAIDEGKELQLYIAKEEKEPSPELQGKLRQVIESEQLLIELREQEEKGTPLEKVIGIDLEPDSGISVRFVD